MRTIAISSHKGGSAKTVSALSISAGLARLGRRVLLIDLDPQGHSTRGLGIDIADGEKTIGHALQKTPVAEVVRKTNVPGLDILPATISLEPIEQSLYAQPRREEVLRRVLEPVRPRYDFAVIDCRPSLGALTHNGLTAADFVLVPCEIGARAADGLIDLLGVVKVLKGDEFNAWRIVLTKVDARKTVSMEAVLTSLEKYRDHILETQIPASEALNQAQIAGEDIFRFDPKGKGAAAYEALIQEILPYAK